jgi:hypothetical protein
MMSDGYFQHHFLPGEYSMQAPNVSSPQISSDFPPLPLRARGVIELLDLTIKVFRRYFGVLVAWAAILIGGYFLVAGMGAASMGTSLFRNPTPDAILGAVWTVGALMFGAGLLGFLCYPLVVGAVACCVAAAVRGQRVTFAQCWEFTRPRYGPMLLYVFLTGLVGILAAIGLTIFIGLVVAASVAIGSALPTVLQVVLAIVGVVSLYAALIVGMLV